MLDTIFYCAFTSCASTWYPPRVIAFDGTRGLDVSNDPALAPLFRADMRKARDACEHRIHEAQGACAGFAVDAARLGELDRASPIIRAQVLRSCRTPVKERLPVAGECYHDDRFPAGFEAELAAALRRAGYIHD